MMYVEMVRCPQWLVLWSVVSLRLQSCLLESPVALPAPGLSAPATLRTPQLPLLNEESGLASVPSPAAQALDPLAAPLFSLPSTPISPLHNPPSAPLKLPRRARGKKRLVLPKFAPLDWATAAAPPSLSGAELRFPKPIAPWDTFVKALEATLSRREKTTLSKRGIAPTEPAWWCLPRSTIILVNFVRKRLTLGTEIGSVVLEFWLDVLIAAGFAPCEGLVTWAVDTQYFASSKLVKVFVSHNELAARCSATREQPLWATLFTVASLRARTLIPREASALTASSTRTFARSGAPAAVTPSHGTTAWGRPNRNAVLLAARPRTVVFEDEASRQASVLDSLPRVGGNGRGSSGKAGRSTRGSRGNRAVLGEGAPVVSTDAAVLPLKAAAVSSPPAADQLPPIPDEEFPSSTLSAVTARTGWGSDNEVGGGETELASQGQVERAGVCYSDDEDEEGVWKLVGRARPRPSSPEPPTPHSSSTDSSGILSDQGELEDWNLGESSSRASSPVASPSKPAATSLVAPLLPPASSSPFPTKRAAKSRRRRLSRSTERKLEAVVLEEAVSLHAADMADLLVSKGKAGLVSDTAPDSRPEVEAGSDPNAAVVVGADTCAEVSVANTTVVEVAIEAVAGVVVGISADPAHLAESAMEAVAGIVVDVPADPAAVTAAEVGEGLGSDSASDTDTCTNADPLSVTGAVHEVRHVQNGSGDHIDMVPVK